MRLPFLQVSQEEMARARTLAGYLSVPFVHALGMTVALKSAALEAAPEGDVSGTINDPNPAEWVAVQCGWPMERADALFTAMARCGFVMVGPSNGHAVAGMEPYAKALDTSGRRSDAGRKGAEARKSKGGYGRAMAGPQQSDGQYMARNAKTQTQTQTHRPSDEGVRAGARGPGEEMASPGGYMPPRTRPSTADAEVLGGGDGTPGLWARLMAAWLELRPGLGKYPEAPESGPRGPGERRVLADLLALGQQEAGYGRAAEDEVLRRWRLALVRTAFPRCDKLAHLLDNWTSYAAEEAPRARPAGADVGRGEIACGACEAGCGAAAATALHGHALCYRCAGLAGQEVANFSPESVGAWLASRRAAA